MKGLVNIKQIEATFKQHCFYGFGGMPSEFANKK